jgi:tetratricopeptide (TPR) repeat protein
MPDLPFDPPKDRPLRGHVSLATADKQHYGRRDILAMYPALRLDHLRYLEKCGLIKPAADTPNDRNFGFADLAVLRQIAAELQQGAAFKAVVRQLQASRTGQLAFDFRLEAQPTRIIELKSRAHPGVGTSGTSGANGLLSEPELSEAEQYFLMGSLLDDGSPERTEEAIKAYRRALDHDPDLVAALINLANIRYSRDELAEAQALYERAIALDPSYFEAHFNLGNIHHDHARYADAEASYRNALALNNNYPDAHFYLAVTLEKMGRSIDARTHWRTYERLAPQGEWVELAKEFSD